MSKILVIGARLEELHEAVKYANSHGNGVVTIKADELAELLPALPVEVKPDVPAAEPVPVAAEHGETIAQAAAPSIAEQITVSGVQLGTGANAKTISEPIKPTAEEVAQAEGTGEPGAEHDPAKPPTVQ